MFTATTSQIKTARTNIMGLIDELIEHFHIEDWSLQYDQPEGDDGTDHRFTVTWKQEGWDSCAIDYYVGSHVDAIVVAVRHGAEVRHRQDVLDCDGLDGVDEDELIDELLDENLLVIQ